MLWCLVGGAGEVPEAGEVSGGRPGAPGGVGGGLGEEFAGGHGFGVVVAEADIDELAPDVSDDEGAFVLTGSSRGVGVAAQGGRIGCGVESGRLVRVEPPGELERASAVAEEEGGRWRVNGGGGVK